MNGEHRFFTGLHLKALEYECALCSFDLQCPLERLDVMTLYSWTPTFYHYQ